MFNVTPIGSCRIYAPLRLSTKEYGFKINVKRVYGYSHSLGEILQQADALFNDFQPPEYLWPMISSRSDLATFSRQAHEKSNLYIIELSSAKNVKIGNYYVQLNYFNRHFKDFFSDAARARTFNGLCTRDNPSELEDFLEKVWIDTPEHQKETEILKQVRVTLSTEDELYEGICDLQFDLENTLFVSHVDVKTNNENKLKARHEFIKKVTSAARRAEAALYNPTALMEKFGQQNAIEDYSTSFAHFTESFSKEVFADCYKRNIRDALEESLLESPEENINDMLVPHTRSILETGDPELVEELGDLLDAVEGYYPENIQIKEMQLDKAFYTNEIDQIKRVLFRLIFSCDLSKYKGKLDNLAQISQLESWLGEIFTINSIPNTSMPVLKKLANLAGASEMAKSASFPR